MHLTFDQWLKISGALGGLGTFGAFLVTIYRRMIRPLFLKISSVIDEEKQFRQQIRDTITTVSEFKIFFDSIKSELADLVDLVQWAAAMRKYADVRIVTKAKAATGEEVELPIIKKNGGLEH